MSKIDVEKIKISPFEFDTIVEVVIEKTINDHSTMFVSGIVKDGSEISHVTSASEGTSVKCENDGQVYFDGVLKSVEIACEGELYSIKINAVSNTIKLDTVKYRRSFQDNSQSYESIVNEVIGKKSGITTFNADKTTVENIILQYDETDWEFAKRLASHTQDVLIPILGSNPAFHFGATDEGTAVFNTEKYTISRDFDKLRLMSEEEEPLTDKDVTIYTAETDEFICDIGEKFTLNGIDLRVCHMHLSFINGALVIVYSLCDKKAIAAPKYYNQNFIGLVLDGKVLEVKDDNVKLHLNIDDKQDAGTAHLFVYATNYSTESHTGWYVMPEEGDNVQLYFPKADEKYAYAKSSIRLDDTERTADPLVKYWRTSFGKEIKMDKDEILITSKDDETFIQIRDDKKIGIHIITPHPVVVNSGSTVNIESADDMKLISGKSIFIHAKKSIELVGDSSSITLKASGIDEKGRLIREN